MVYFAQSVDGGPIKIGWSSDVPTRIRQLEAHYGTPLAILATMPGEFDEEQAVHARFSHLRFGRTEQFRPAPDLMAFIGRPLLVGANPDTVEAMSSKGGTMIRVTDEVAEALRKACALENCTAAEFSERFYLPVIQKRYRELIAAESKILGEK